jgi:hypothetical protein
MIVTTTALLGCGSDDARRAPSTAPESPVATTVRHPTASERREQEMWRSFTRAERVAFRKAYFLCNEWFAHDNDPQRGEDYIKSHAGAARLGCGYGSNGVGPYGSALPDLP